MKLMPGKKGGEGRSSRGGPNVRRTNYTLIGTVVTSLLAIGLILGITRPEWQQYLDWGFTTREVHMTGDYFVLANSSKIKIGGVEVGRIDNIEREPDGSSVMKVRVRSDVPDLVGSAPSANLRTATLLGGIVYIDLLPGGDRTQPWRDPIPVERTQLPTELSQVVQTIQPDALKGLPATVNGLQGALNNGGVQAIGDLGRYAPGALGPGAGVINSLSGNNPGTDLPAVVNGLQKTTAVLHRQDGQIQSILADLHTTTSAFAASSKPTAQAIHELPSALDTARPGLARLSGTLDNLKATAGPARPTVQELDKLLQRLDPFLVHARPVVNDLRYALIETRPLVQALVPASQDLRTVFDGLDPTLDRVNGPIIGALEDGFHPDSGNQAGRRHEPLSASNIARDNPAPKLRQELGPFARGLGAASGYYDARAHGVSFSVNAGTESFGGGVPIDLPTLYQVFTGMIPPLTGSSASAAAARGPLAGLPVPAAPVATAAPLAAPAAGAAVPNALGGLQSGGTR